MLEHNHIEHIHSTLNNPSVKEMIGCVCQKCINGQDPFYYDFGTVITCKEKNIGSILCQKSFSNVSTEDILAGIQMRPRPMETEWDVFIAYSRKDRSIIQEITIDFKNRGITYWWDGEPGRITAEDDVLQKLELGLTNSRCILVCLSYNQLDSDWSFAEYTAVLNKVIKGDGQKKIIPVILDNMEDKDIPDFLTKYRCFHILNRNEYGELLRLMKSGCEQDEPKNKPTSCRKTIDILISETSGKYHVSLTSKDFGGSQIQLLELPDKLKDYELQEILVKISHEQIAQGYNSPLPGQIGEALWDTFFQNTDFKIILHSAYDKPPCRICIQTNDDKVSHILVLPWEYLRIASKVSGFLVHEFSIVRQVNATGTLPDEPSFLSPLKFLAVIVQPLSIKENRFKEDQVKSLFSQIQMPGKLEIKVVQLTMLKSLALELQDNPADYDGFIFFGHGGIEKTTGDTNGTLSFEDARNSDKPDNVDASRLMTALKRSESPMKLMLLNACEGGGEATDRGYRSVAAQIVAQGIPWGIGWKYPVLFQDTLSFTEAFLKGLVNSGSVESAIIQAREELILTNSNSHPCWGSPSLFARHNWSRS